jgi:hypothetical protein
MVLLNLVLWPLPLQAGCSLNEDTVDFLISYVSLELAKIMNHLLVASRNATETQDQIFQQLGQINFIHFYTHCWELMKSLGTDGS